MNTPPAKSRWSIHANFTPPLADAEEREYLDGADPIRAALIHGNYLARKDINIITEFSVL